MRAALFVLLLVLPGTTRALGQTPPEGPVLLVRASPMAPSYLGVRRQVWNAGVGVRVAGFEAIATAGRGSDVPHGNPLPVTEVGHTILAARIGTAAGSDPDGSDFELALGGLLTVVDLSRPTQRRDLERIDFRGDRALTEWAVRAEGVRLWRVEGPGLVARVTYAVGGILEYRRVRAGTILDEARSRLIRVAGSHDWSAAAVVGVAVSVTAWDGATVTLEPYAHALPGFYYAPTIDLRPGLRFTLAF